MAKRPKEDALQGSYADKLINAAVDIRMSPDAVERSYMARQLVQCTLPHSDPGDVSVWARTNGYLTLAIRPYVDLKTRKPLYPYGSIPRLLLFWLVTEATQKKTRRIRLGNSLDSFMREIGLNPRTGGGKRGDAARLHSQMERLFRAIVTFEDKREWSKSYVDMQIAPRGTLWWDPARSHQDNLWESWVELGEDFYAAITAAPVPVDMRALRALKRSPLALDLYAWLAHTAFSASRKREPRVVPWEGLHGQMGAEYAELRQFRAKVLLALKKIQLVYPALKLETTSSALIVHPSPTAIPAKS
ncbi:replication protein RepA [Acidipila sp. EB88]|uniref:replication protein RepA n=1 Tax=Acidipila sp. EB88 TaxID=2305226 RepID=UPI000F5E8F6A|nr:replication protein RepA [Acidipila sp. EB88]RRA50329.1 plasmid encoded RepA protein [Acidipila sp. EB88]RRA50340.1 plasmid encoded RepA protein [Acidipila sp. EB88]